MTKILLVRHGETTANRSEIFAGYTNAQLLERGRIQASLTAAFLIKNYKIDQVYSSDLDRAYETGKAVGDLLGKDVIIESDMREINGGDWEGVKFNVLLEEDAEAYGIWLTDLKNARCTGGESVDELKERVMNAMTKLAEKNKEKTIVVVSHGTPIRVIECMAKYGNLDRLSEVPWASNAAVTELEYRDGIWECISANMDEHLGEVRTVLPENI